MSDIDFQRVKRLLNQLRDEPVATRAQRLRSLCAGDRALEDEVLSLLPMAEEPDDRLSAPDGRRALLDALLDAGAGTEASPTDGERGSAQLPVVEGSITAGTRLGHFVLGELLGAGGMGQVYAAVQDEPHRQVAIKLLGPGPVSKALLDRFRHEIHVLGSLDHPGIAALYEAGAVRTDEGERPWFAMPIVGGRRLDEWVRERNASPEEVIELFLAVTDAVAHAHARGVVHRDLKPANILVDDQGRPTVLDFGVARLTEEHSLLSSLHTEAGQLLGTLPYMSPEQVSGDVDQADARSDVYSLGVILFEALTGRLPLEITGLSLPAAASLIRDQDPPRLRELAPSLAGDLEVVVDTALCKEPERRYVDARALGDDLRRFRDHLALAARPLSTYGQLVRFVRRNRAIAVGSAVAGLALVVATVVSLYHAGRSADDRVLALREADRARVSAAAAALQAFDPMSARSLLDHVPEPDRSWEWQHYAQELTTHARALTAPDDLIDTALVDAGAVLVQLTTSGRVIRRRVADDALLSTVELNPSGADQGQVSFSGAHAQGSRLSADGTRAATERDGEIVVWDTTTARIVDRVASGCVGDEPLGLELDVSGGALLWRHGRAVSWWRPASGEAPRLLPVSSTSNWFQLQVAGGRFAVGGQRGELVLGWLEPPEGEAPRRNLRPGFQRFRSLTLSDDGRRVAVGTERTAIVVLDCDTGEVLAQLDGHTQPARALAFVDDGRRLVSAGMDGTLRVWDVDERRLLSCLGIPGAKLMLLRATGEGSVLSGRTPQGLLVWELDALEQQRVLRGHERYVYDLAFDPAGDSLVSASWDRTLRWWGLAAAAAQRVVRLESRPSALAYSPSGDRLLVIEGSRLWEFGRHDEAPPQPRLVGRTDVSELAWLDERRVLVGRHRLERELRPPTILDVSTGQELDALPVEGKVGPLAVSADGSHAALSTDRGRIELWSLSDLRRLGARDVPVPRITALAFSPDGRLLILAGEDGSALVTSVAGDADLPLAGNTSEVHTVAWHPGGERVATGSDDGIVRVYDVRDGVMVAQLRGHDDYVHGLAFSPDGTLLASASGDQTVRLWHTRPLAERLADPVAASAPARR